MVGVGWGAVSGRNANKLENMTSCLGEAAVSKTLGMGLTLTSLPSRDGQRPGESWDAMNL